MSFTTSCHYLLPRDTRDWRKEGNNHHRISTCRLSLSLSLPPLLSSPQQTQTHTHIEAIITTLFNINHTTTHHSLPPQTHTHTHRQDAVQVHPRRPPPGRPRLCSGGSNLLSPQRCHGRCHQRHPEHFQRGQRPQQLSHPSCQYCQHCLLCRQQPRRSHRIGLERHLQRPLGNQLCHLPRRFQGFFRHQLGHFSWRCR